MKKAIVFTRNKAYALFWLLRASGRVQGNSFVIRRPARIKVDKGSSLVLGSSVVIDKFARIEVRNGARLLIGRNSYVGSFTVLVAYSDIRIGENARLGERVSVHTESHGGANQRDSYTSEAIVIGADAWLAANSVVLGGVEIGRGATVGANAVVTRSVAAHAIVGGVPARTLPH